MAAMRERVRYSYGGHLTFPIRYGWLPKGIDRIVHHGGYAANTDTADELGLGSKMAESLAFWLRSMGLLADGPAGGRTRSPTALARLVFDHDAHCELPGTWWLFHLALATSPGTVWAWFFNIYADRIFDRVGCADAYLQHTRSCAQRPATPAMAQKDVACLLAAYASRPGVDMVDPDDLGACPLRELGLVLRHESVNRFERLRTPSGVPVEAFLACASALALRNGRDGLALRELANAPFGPGRVFCAGLDAIEELAAAAAAGSRYARLDSLAGERRLLVEHRPIEDWAQDLYRRLGIVRA